MTNLLIVWFIVKVREVVGSLIVRNEVEQPQELAMNATRGRHARGQKRQRPIAVVRLSQRLPIGADRVSISLVKDHVRPVRVAERAMVRASPMKS